MLTAAGLTETWLFKKARILAIFDDLDTILFMLPLKVIVSGLSYDLILDLILLTIPLVLGWIFMHRVNLPSWWACKAVYSVIIVAACKGLYVGSKYEHGTEPLSNYTPISHHGLHLEVLLPAFVVGCVLTFV